MTETTENTGNEKLNALLTQIDQLNASIFEASHAKDYDKVRGLIDELRVVALKLGRIGGSEAATPLVAILAEAAQAYDGSDFEEAYKLRETAFEALRQIGQDAIPAVKKGASDRRVAVRETCFRALKALGVKPWWQFW
ncbi:MAG: hypothetical protein OEV28_02720 [Nitrospirota bacterium]|nr:hypothetical protein [Nitrospirota bacterium]